MVMTAVINGEAGSAATGIERGRDWGARLRRAWQEHRRYRVILAELGALGDRELADLGMFRVDLRAIARAAARDI